MPNTPQEDQLVRDAVNQLSKVYSDYLIGNRFVLGVLGCPSNQLFNWVHFLDDAPFRSNLQLSGKIPDGCQVRGSTDRQGTRFAKDHSVVWINRSAATAGTVLHELLHALSDNSWYLWAYSKKPWLNEATTEYLTRKVIKKTDNATFQEDRTGTYEDELGNLKQMKTMTKQAFSMPMVRTGRRQQQQLPPNQSATSLKADICAAYFRGQFAQRLNDALALYG
jgi:hypothetical protein